MLNVLLINLPIDGLSSHSDSSDFASRYIQPPSALMYLAGKLINEDCINEIQCLDYNAIDYSGISSKDEYCKAIVEKLSGVRYTQELKLIVCISITYSITYSFFELLVKRAKKMFPNSTIVCGGMHATSTVDVIFSNNPEVDYVVCGEGEECLLELIKAICLNRYENIMGVHTKSNIKRQGDGSFETAMLPHDISMNLEAYDVFDMELYTKVMPTSILQKSDVEKRYYSILVSRGCPVQCTFCAARTVHGLNMRWRDVEDIRSEIMYVYNNFGVTWISMMDSIITPKSKAMEFLEMLSSTPKDISYSMGGTSVNHIDEEIIDAMVKANFDYIYIPIETGSKEMQKKVKKNVNLDKAVKLIQYAKSVGLKTWCYYMLGFPEESLEQMQETIDFAKKAKSDWANFFVASPLPGTDMYNQFIEMGYIKNSPEYWNSYRAFDTKEISASDLSSLAYKANLDYNFVQNRFISEGRYDEAEKLFLRFVKKYDFHIFGWDCLEQVYIATDRYSDAHEARKKIESLLNENQTSQALNKYYNELKCRA